MTLKYVGIFGAQQSGWTETFYTDGGSIPTTLTVANSWANQRCRLLAQGAYLEAIRITIVEQPGPSHFETYDPSYTQERAYPTVRDTVQTAVTARLEASNGSRRLFMITGVPDNLVFYDPVAGKMVFDEVFVGRFNLFRNVLKNTPFLLMVLSKDPTTVALRDISAMTSSGNGFFSVTVPSNPYVALDRVRINQVPNSARGVVSGTWRVDSVSGNVITIQDESATTAFSVGPGGKIRRQVTAFAPITTGQVLRVANRKRGRAFFVPLGRRRAK